MTSKTNNNNNNKLLWDFDIHTDYLISARRPDLIIINKKNENLQNCRLCRPGWLQNKTERIVKRRISTSTLRGNWKCFSEKFVKIKGRKILGIFQSAEKLYNMRVTVIPFVTWGTIPKVLEKRLEELEIKGKIETTQTFQTSARILSKVLETWEDLLSLRFQGTATSWYWCEELARKEISKVGDLSRGWPKAPFSIATTPRCREGRNSISRIAPLYSWFYPYSAEC